jgi:hypothetical protein
MSPDDVVTGVRVFSLIVSVVSIVLAVYALWALREVSRDIEGERQDPPKVSTRMKALGLVWKQDHTGEWYVVCGFCGGNCGQCGVTGTVGNHPASMDEMVKNVTERK